MHYLSTRARKRVDSLQHLHPHNQAQQGLLTSALCNSEEAERSEAWLYASTEDLVELVADSVELDEYVAQEVALVRLCLRHPVQIAYSFSRSFIASRAADRPTRKS